MTLDNAAPRGGVAVHGPACQDAFDRDPPFARTELNYDPLTGDPIGRTVKLGLRKRF